MNKEPAGSAPQPLPQSSSAKAPRLTQMLRPFFWALGAIVILGILYQIIERTWLVHADMEFVHLVHKAGGILSSLLVGLVVGWSILRGSPAFLATPGLEEEWLRQPRLTEAERIKLYARWFISMRWIAVLVAALLVIITVKLVGWLPSAAWWPLLLTVCALAVANILYTVLLKQERALSVLLQLQAYLDLVLLTVLLQFSGGVENPLAMMMIFHVIIGGILLSRRQCYGIAAAASLLFAVLIWGEWAKVLNHYTLDIYPHFEATGEFSHPAHHISYVATSCVLQTVILFLTAYFVTTLAERMRYNERHLEAMADRALAERQLLERSLETTGTGLRVLSRDLRAYWMSKHWEQWFSGVSAAPASGQTLEGQDSAGQRCLTDGQTRVTELVLAQPDGNRNGAKIPAAQRVFQVTTAPLLDGIGKVNQVVELAQEITQQKRTQEQMMRAGKLAAVGQLAGQVAHEVNNPIAILSAKARLLLTDRRSEMSPKIAEELGKITELADRVARIAQGLLSYCRPSATTRTLLDVRQPLRKSLTMIEQPARQRGVKIEEHLSDAPPRVNANAAELEQIFLNLFLNALDAMPKGGTLEVNVAAKHLVPGGQSTLTITVSDTGTGIPGELRERIFEPFFTTKQEGRGTGLGLSICQGLVRSHGGEIEVESEPGKGARFLVKLPVASESQDKTSHA